MTTTTNVKVKKLFTMARDVYNYVTISGSLVFLLALVYPIHGEYNNTDIVIMPMSQTSRGAIGAGRICPHNEFAIGYRLKMHNQVGATWHDDQGEAANLIVRTEESGSTTHGTFDNTALNGIRLLCTGGLEAKSSEGPKGTWTDFLHCQGKTDYMVGARIKSEKWLGWDYDDVGAINFEAICLSGARLLHRPMPSWINDRGDWSEFTYCPKEAPAVCGIKSRIDLAEPLQPRFQVQDKRGDQAGLTEVQLKCCKV